MYNYPLETYQSVLEKVQQSTDDPEDLQVFAAIWGVRAIKAAGIDDVPTGQTWRRRTG